METKLLKRHISMDTVLLKKLIKEIRKLGPTPTMG
jgi:hypothetical protein